MLRDAEILAELGRGGSLRKLRDVRVYGAFIEVGGEKYVNLSSNDYLGLSDSELQKEFFEKVDFDEFLMSNPSSRLMTGNSLDYMILEGEIAQFHGFETALVVGSGFLLNSGVLPAITTNKDLIVCDKFMHASLIDGVRLSSARLERFRHNDIEHLECILQKADAERIIVATESVFSMDGDIAPLREIAALQKKYDFEFYLDEAHAVGVFGRNGCGMSAAVEGLRVDYLVGTMGKAFCSQGGYVACSYQIKELLINKMRTLIYSTALPPISLKWSLFVLEKMGDLQARREHLFELISLMGGESQIIPYIIGCNEDTLAKAKWLQERGFWATAIRQPTVPAGTSRLRFSLSATHSTEQIKELCRLIG